MYVYENIIEMSMTKKKDLITQEEIDACLRHISNINSNISNQEQLLKLLQEVQITLDDNPIFEDSIDGTRIRATYTIETNRKGRGGEKERMLLDFNISKKSLLIMIKCLLKLEMILMMLLIAMILLKTQ